MVRGMVLFETDELEPSSVHAALTDLIRTNDSNDSAIKIMQTARNRKYFMVNLILYSD